MHECDERDRSFGNRFRIASDKCIFESKCTYISTIIGEVLEGIYIEFEFSGSILAWLGRYNEQPNQRRVQNEVEYTSIEKLGD
jgi:hypothetical protein